MNRVSRSGPQKNTLLVLLLVAAAGCLALLGKGSLPAVEKIPLHLSLRLPSHPSIFTRINSVHLYAASNLALDTLLPFLKDSKNNPEDDIRDINIKVTVVYSAARSGPWIMPLSIEKFSVTPNFDTANSFYFRHRPPGYTISVLVYSGQIDVKTKDLKTLLVPRISGQLPIVYDPGKHFKKIPRSEPEPNDEPRMMVRSERRDSSNVHGNYQARCRLYLVPVRFAVV